MVPVSSPRPRPRRVGIEDPKASHTLHVDHTDTSHSLTPSRSFLSLCYSVLLSLALMVLAPAPEGWDNQYSSSSYSTSEYSLALLVLMCYCSISASSSLDTFTVLILSMSRVVRCCWPLQLYFILNGVGFVSPLPRPSSPAPEGWDKDLTSITAQHQLHHHY